MINTRAKINRQEKAQLITSWASLYMVPAPRIERGTY